MIDPERLLSSRAKSVDGSGIRRAFQLGATLVDPINLSIGQPDFAVPEQLCEATIEAIRKGRNGYTMTGGANDLRQSIGSYVASDVGWDMSSGASDLLVTSGTSGALLLAFMVLCDAGCEAIVPDPWFVIYPTLGPMTGTTIVPCDTYDDFRMTAARVEPLITDRTKIVLINSPGNPTGVVLTDDEMRDLADLCVSRGIMLVSDEIYDLFTFADGRSGSGPSPSPARYTRDMLLIRGFGKTYGCTGWRMGWAAGPSWLIEEMGKFQQYSFVCAPSMAQAGLVGAFDIDMSETIHVFERRRDMVREILGSVTDISDCRGAFYSFVKVPEHLGMTGTAFSERASEQNVVTIPGGVFSARDTHIRLSFACQDDKLRKGLEILRELM